MGNWLFKKGVKGAEVILANTDQIPAMLTNLLLSITITVSELFLSSSRPDTATRLWGEI